MESKEAVAVHHFDPNSLVYAGSSVAYIGPAGDCQVPAFAMLEAAPEAPSGSVARATSIDGGTWEIVRDWRSTAVYRIADGSRYEFGASDARFAAWDGIGDMPAGFTEQQKPDGYYAWDGTAWAFDIVAARAAAVAAVDAKRADVLASPFQYGDNRFNADAGSITQIAAMAQLATVAKLAEQPYTAIWTSADGVDVMLDADGMVGLAMAAAARQPAAYQIATQLKSQIAAAGDEAALAAIVWPQ
ncbi:DUF4376 domain-containing protein [Burkholderia sp. Bp9017]|uniref:DUF4376 domain-containing protein n=1 Tax=unclassified Burkholderia TaxID=2613784 RepID=UPI000F5E744B|nr:MULTISPECIES: DUF4376 domain-containing protein [unclassified Burkholderia]RQZ25143.1 DUF4376 domain-containing protein [Burkholderia sp. Bp9017]RQZ33137.1 DUF4376 domain-containing protein [Burkholderia sp. Bp9016]